MALNTKIRIFLASSSELAEDRVEFELSINRKNKEWMSREVFLHLDVWEDFLDALSQTRLQDEYNNAIRECDIFVMLFCTKVGKYTEEEFEAAFGQFKKTNKPLIFIYFKDAEITTVSANKSDLESLWAFKKKLENLGHFLTVYKNIDALKYHFNTQLDKLANSGFIAFEPDRTNKDDITSSTKLEQDTSAIRTQFLEVLLREISHIQIPGLKQAVKLEAIWTRPSFVVADEGEMPLHKILANRAIAIEAPAGFGKTTLSKIVAISLVSCP